MNAESLSAGSRFLWLGEVLTVVGPPYEDARPGGPAEVVILCTNEKNRNRTVRVKKGRQISTL